MAIFKPITFPCPEDLDDFGEAEIATLATAFKDHFVRVAPKRVLFIPSLVRVRRPCRGLEKFFPPVLQRCYGCSFHAQEIVHTGHGMLGYNCFFLFFFWRERCLPKVS